MLGIDADAHRAPRRVNQACAGVLEHQLLERLEPGRLGESLCIIRNSPGHRVPDHHDELGVSAHGVDTARGFFGYEVAGGLLHGELTVQCSRHQIPALKQKPHEYNSTLKEKTLPTSILNHSNNILESMKHVLMISHLA